MQSIAINGRQIGEDSPVYVVAEMSANHNQDFDQAVRIIHAAKEAGADAIKVQTYRPDTITIDCANEHFRIGKGTIWQGRTLYDLYSEAFTPWEWQPKLKEIAAGLGLDMFSSPFDCSAVEFLEQMQVAAHKIASFEIVDLALIQQVARTGKPIIMATGMATRQEIEEAISAAREMGATDVALLKCTSAYPAPPEEMNLNTIPDMAKSYNVPVGLSDHSMGIAVPVAAVALGACIVEKHLTLSRDIPGPDSAFSLEPDEFKAMVSAIRIAEKSIGKVHYGPSPREADSLVFRRSLFAVRDMKAGETFTEENVRSIRPGYGLPPKFIRGVLGRSAVCDIARGTPLAWSHIGEAPTI